LNNYYFVKDGSKKGTYIRLHGHKQNKRVELHKGMTFSVGRVQFKVSNIEGDAVDNRELKAQMEKEAAERAAKAAEDEGAGKKKDAELESDEEFADDSDDDDKGKSSGKKSKLDGPPVMFLSTLDKKKPIRGRIRETSTIGSDKEKNKIAIPEEVAKERKVSSVHTRVCLENGRFFLEDAGSSFGTYVGLPKKKFFEINIGDHLLFGSARVIVGVQVIPFQPLTGLIVLLLGKNSFTDYKVELCGRASIQARMDASMDSAKVKKQRQHREITSTED